MGDLLDRFSGDENKPRLIDALERQRIVMGDKPLAEAMAEKGTLQELGAGDTLITQGAWDDDVYFIVAGEFAIKRGGVEIRRRAAGIHVGELSGINPGRPRSLTVQAVTPSLVLKLSMLTLNEITQNNTEFWKRIADVNADRLEERNQMLGKTNDIPRVFVISSSEAKPVMDAVVRCLDDNTIAVDTWTDGTFGISDYPISSLMDRIEASDFTISIVSADDTLISRLKEHKVARDNVHLEYGISLGILGRPRSVLLVCASEDVKLPSDTAGLTTLRYSHKSEDEMKRSIRRACMEMREHIKLEGVFQERKPSK